MLKIKLGSLLESSSFGRFGDNLTSDIARIKHFSITFSYQKMKYQMKPTKNYHKKADKWFTIKSLPAEHINICLVDC